MKIINFRYILKTENTIIDMVSAKGTKFECLLNYRGDFEVRLPNNMKCPDEIVAKLKEFCKENAKKELDNWSNNIKESLKWTCRSVYRQIEIFRLGLSEYYRRQKIAYCGYR